MKIKLRSFIKRRNVLWISSELQLTLYHHYPATYPPCFFYSRNLQKLSQNNVYVSHCKECLFKKTIMILKEEKSLYLREQMEFYHNAQTNKIQIGPSVSPNCDR